MPTCPNCAGLGFDEDSDDECNLCEGTGVLKGEEEKKDNFPTFNPDNFETDADWWKKDQEDEVKD